MTEKFEITVGKYHFSGAGAAPSEELLMQMLSDSVSGVTLGRRGIPPSVFEDEREKGEEFMMQYDELCQEVSLTHPYITCIHDGLPPGVEAVESAEEDEEDEMHAHFLTTPEYDSEIKPKAIELAKSFGLI